MTTLQKTITVLALAAAIAVGIYQARYTSALRRQNDALTGQVQELAEARSRATNINALLTAENVAFRKRPSDIARLRSEVGMLKDQNASIKATSPMSKITADPTSRKVLRDAQKAALAMMYKEFAIKLKLTTDQTDKFNDLLADNLMTNVDNVTIILRDKPAPDQIDSIFTAQDSALQQQIQEMLGADGLAQYLDYTKNLLALVTATQFKDQLTGTPDEQTEKATQLTQLLEQQSQAVLAANNLPADYQTIPTLNPKNFVSEQEAIQGIQVLSDIYQQTIAQAGSFLSPAELEQFKTFTVTVVNNNQGSISLNRNLMAPIQ